MKFIITGMHSSRKHEFMYYLAHFLPEYFKTARLTSTDPYYKKDHTYRYFTESEIKQIFDNRAFVFLHNGQGLIKSSFEDCNLFTLSIEDFIMVPNYYHFRNDITVIWIDSTKGDRKENHKLFQKRWNFDSLEEYQKSMMNQFVESLQGKKVLYFKDQSNIEMLSKIMQYIEETDPKKKEKFLESDI